MEKNALKTTFAFFVFFSVLAGASQTAEVYEVINPPDTNQPFVSAHDSVNELDENFISSPFDGNFDFVEEPAKDIYRIENGEWILVKDDGDDNSVNGQNNSCDEATPDVYGTIKRAVIDNSQDVDWYKGTRSSNNKVRVVLVPPNNKNYNIEIWDDCDTWRKTCSAGRGEIENCAQTSGINGDFYVKVVGAGGDWSQQAPYYLMAYNDEPCTFDLYAGRPTKDSYECMDTIQVDSTRISNRTNDTFKLTFRQDLWLPSGDFQNETNAAPYDLPPNGHAYASGRHFAPQNGWPENGFYTARAVIIGYCDASDAINAAKVNSSPPPQVSCTPCQDECSYNGQKRCNGNNSETCGNYDGDNCLEWGGGQYCSNGCNQQNGQCNSCESHHHDGCFDNDIYWYNSCNEREERKEDCRVNCVNDGRYYCMNGCLGNFRITVKNQQGAVEPNATVSFKHSNMSDFAFAGLTNQDGKLDFFDIYEYANSCGWWYDIRAVSANGADCGTRYTFIESEGDIDGVMFMCPIVNNDNFLRVAPDGPERIKLGQVLDLRALITDRYYTPVSEALVGVNRPYNETPLSDNTDDQGNATFLDDSVPAGSHNFQFIGSKVGYNYGEAWKRVTVEPQQVYAAVRDNVGNPVWHAEILIEGVSKGFTDNQGKLAIQVTEQVNTLEAKNTDGIHCGYRTVRIGEQANFICPESPLLQVEVDTNSGKPISNIVVALDGEFVDFTNAFGYTLTSVPSGEHTLEIYYQLDENSQKYVQQQRINISEKTTVVSFIADDEHGIPIDGEGMALDGSEIRAQCPFCLILIPVALVAIDIISISADVSELCSCLNGKSESEWFDFDECKEVLETCKINGVNACTDPIRAALTSIGSCPLEYGAVVFDVGPATGAGLAKLGVGAGLPLVGKNKIFKIAEPVGELVDAAKIKGQEAWKLFSHSFSYHVEKIGEEFVTFIKLPDGKTLSRATSEFLEKTVGKNWEDGARVEDRTVTGIFIKAIPDAIEYVEKLSEYALKALKQGIEPFKGGSEQVQRLFLADGVNTKVGREFVENVAVLKKGKHYGPGHGYGWEHIVKQERHNKIMNIFDLENNDAAVKDFIQRGLNEGFPDGRDIIWEVPGYDEILRIVIDDSDVRGQL